MSNNFFGSFIPCRSARLKQRGSATHFNRYTINLYVFLKMSWSYIFASFFPFPMTLERKLYNQIDYRLMKNWVWMLLEAFWSHSVPQNSTIFCCMRLPFHISFCLHKPRFARVWCEFNYQQGFGRTDKFCFQGIFSHCRSQTLDFPLYINISNRFAFPHFLIFTQTHLKEHCYKFNDCIHDGQVCLWNPV